MQMEFLLAYRWDRLELDRLELDRLECHTAMVTAMEVYIQLAILPSLHRLQMAYR